MTEKIEWYREVLELEPGSKLFFPLARLLVEDHRMEEAIDVLEHGLERHEEFLEARLYLIELLHTSGRSEACQLQVSRLSKLFSTYAGFWQAWAASLEHAATGSDIVAVLRFLALAFSHDNVSLSDVFARGLSTYATDTNGSEKFTQQKTQEKEGASQPIMSAMPAERIAEDATCVTKEDTPPDSASISCDSPDTLQSDVPPITESDASEPPADAEETMLLPEQQMDANSIIPDAADEAPAPDSSAVQDVMSIPVADEEDETSEEESFSLRTRSMAEVLAEQGDIKGALDIYHELAAAAVDPEENNDLHQRIATLTARLNNIQQNVVVTATESTHSKDKLICMLEALAERVEARAQQG